MDPLGSLAEQLRAEDTPISPRVVEPGEAADLASRVAAGSRAASNPDEYALVVESVREGYLLHYGEPRILAGHDPDLGLLAGDYLYALGIERLAQLGDAEAVAVLAELIGRCAQVHTEGREAEVPELWDRAVAAVGGSDPAGPAPPSH